MSLKAQNLVRPNPGGYWVAYTGDNSISKKIGLHTETQLRNIFIDERVETKLFRFGLNYYIKPNTIATAGYAFIANFPNEDYLDASRVIENRIWQQILVRHKSRVLFMEHRYRLEQRFLNNQTTATYKIDHRMRYRFQAIFPLYSISPKLRHFFIVSNNELMVNFRKTPSEIFDRNRFSAGIGYQVRPNLNFQFSYMNEFSQLSTKITPAIQRVFLFGITYNMDDIMPGIFNAKRSKSNQQ